jgi:RecA-family ATPase
LNQVASNALSLAQEWDLPVFPVLITRKESGKSEKKPLTTHGFYDAAKNMEQISQWWDRWPSAAVGVPTGKVSKLFIVDIDPAGEGWYRENADRLDCGRVHKTERGWHLVYSMPVGEIGNSAGKLAPGVDVRGTGGYMVWWPATGGQSVGGMEDIKPAPEWLIKALTVEPPKATVTPIHGTGMVGSGQRNDFLSREAYRQKKLGATPEQMLAVLSAINDTRCSPPVDYQELIDIVRGKAIVAADPAQEEPAPRVKKAPLQWDDLSSKTPPVRQWALPDWLGMGYVTLFSGAGGMGKTSIAQAMGSCIALQRDYLADPAQPRKVLMWACEDDEDELWRRQLAIANALKCPLSDFKDQFILQSYDGEDVELCAMVDGRVAVSGMLAELVQQIGDYKAEVVILDNIARLYGCNENDRHQVTQFMALLTGAAKPTGAAVMLLGHPAKGLGSEYSGSTAWEGAARARLYLGRTLPDQEQPQNQPTEDDGVRYLSRRKANYTTKDYRVIRYANGVMAPDEAMRPATSRPTEFAKDIVVRAVVALERMGKYGVAATNSADYLPKLANNYGLTEGVGHKQFITAMRELELAGVLTMEVVGAYQNRSPKKGFKVKV